MYVLFSATDATLVAIDFSKGNVDEGVVDSPPSRGLRRSPIVSPSPLQGSLYRPRSDRSASPTPRSSNTPHRQLYKHIVDEAPLHAPLLVQVGCASAALPLEVGSIHLSSSALDHPRIADNVRTPSLEDGRCQPDSVVEMEHGTVERQHLCLKGNVQLRRFFSF